MDLIKECSDVNFGGIIKVEYLPVEEVVSVPDAVGDYGVLTSPVVLATGSSWYGLYVAEDSFDFKEDGKPDGQGTVYVKQLKGVFPADSKEVRSVLVEMNARKFILKITDSKGDERLLGSLEYPYSFASSFVLDSLFSGDKGHNLSFVSSSPYMSVFVSV